MAVQPILATTLWAAETGSDDDVAERPAKRPRLSTTCSALDNALGGGLDYSSVYCLSSEADSGHKVLCISVLAAHLLSSNDQHATVIDTTNSFDVRTLHTRLVSMLKETPATEKTEERALSLLDRVRIMKAFDFVGLTECIGELRENLEQDRTLHDLFPSASVQHLPRATVGDSEDEEEMLDTPTHVSGPESPKRLKNTDANRRTDTQLLIIDNMTQVAGPLLKNNYVQGQALLISFMRSLGHLTRTHHICTVLMNAATAYKNSTERETPSIFSSCALQPALGKSFSSLADVHLLLHKVPLTAEDAQGIYGTQAQATTNRSPRVQAIVLEVLQDKHSDRVGRWAAFQAGAEGKLKSIS